MTIKKGVEIKRDFFDVYNIAFDKLDMHGDLYNQYHALNNKHIDKKFFEVEYSAYAIRESAKQGYTHNNRLMANFCPSCSEFIKAVNYVDPSIIILKY